MAVGIGASAAFYGLLHSVLLRPLPYSEPDRLVRVWTELAARGVGYFPESVPNLAEIQEAAVALENLAGVATRPGVVRLGDGESVAVSVAHVTWNLLDVLGRKVEIGRGLAEEDARYVATDVPPNSEHPANTYSVPRVALISGELWRSLFGESTQVVGRSVLLNGERLEIIGVLPKDLELVFSASSGVDRKPHIWVPLRPDLSSVPRNSVFLHLVGRLGEGFNKAQVQDELQTITEQLNAAFPAMAAAGAQRRVAGFSEHYSAEIRPVMVALFVAACGLLGIVVMNVSGFLLLRANSRLREFSIMAALGAGRLPLLKTQLVDALCIGIPAAALGALVAGLCGHLIYLSMPSEFSREGDAGMAVPIIVFSLLATLLAMVVASSYAAWKTVAVDFNLLRDKTPTTARSAERFRTLIVAAQIGLSFILVLACGLTLRSMLELNGAELGFDPERVLTFELTLPEDRFDTLDKRHAAMYDVEAALEHVSGVDRVGAVFPLPLSGREFNGPYVPRPPLGDATDHRQANYKIVHPGYFETVGASLLAGRLLKRADDVDERRVVVVNKQLADAAWPGEVPLGKSLWLRFSTPETVPFEVVGVIANQIQARPLETPVPTAYVTVRASGLSPPMTWVASSTGQRPDQMTDDIRSALGRVLPLTPLSEVRPLAAYVRSSTSQNRFAMAVLTILASVAWVVAVVGLYSAVRFSAQRRRGEVALRMAVGARQDEIIRGFVVRSARPVGIGLVLGSAVFVLAFRWVPPEFLHVPRWSPVLIAVAVGLSFAASSSLAALLAAWQTSGVQPAEALRNE